LFAKSTPLGMQGGKLSCKFKYSKHDLPFTSRKSVELWKHLSVCSVPNLCCFRV